MLFLLAASLPGRCEVGGRETSPDDHNEPGLLEGPGRAAKIWKATEGSLRIPGLGAWAGHPFKWLGDYWCR